VVLTIFLACETVVKGAALSERHPGELRIKPSAEAQNQHALFIQGPPSARAVPGRNANFDLEWAYRRLSSATDPDILGAVRQLGLKLEPAQDIVDTIVVNYSEQPTAN